MDELKRVTRWNIKVKCKCGSLLQIEIEDINI